MRQVALLQIGPARKPVALKRDVDVRQTLGRVDQLAFRLANDKVRTGLSAGLLHRQKHLVPPHLLRQLRVGRTGVWEQNVKANGLGLVAGIGQLFEQIGIHPAVEGPAAQLVNGCVVDANDDHVVRGQRGSQTMHLVINDQARRGAPLHDGEQAQSAERQHGDHHPFQVKALFVA